LGKGLCGEVGLEGLKAAPLGKAESSESLKGLKASLSMIGDAFAPGVRWEPDTVGLQ
jgi:hypothetical protein